MTGGWPFSTTTSAFDNPAATPPLTTDTWLLRSANGGATWTEERIGNGPPGVVTPGDGRGSFDMTTAPDALGYFVGDYAGLDFAGGGSRPGYKPFQVRAARAALLAQPRGVTGVAGFPIAPHSHDPPAAHRPHAR
jgi:hypothetical protein